MLQDLIAFYHSFPDTVLSTVFRKSRSDITPEMLAALLQHRDGMLHNLSMAMIFQIDDAAEDMLARLMNEMSRDGLEDTFQSVQLPFPAMIIEKTTAVDGFRGIGLLTQIDGVIQAQFHAVDSEGLMPSLNVISTATFPFKIDLTPTGALCDLAPEIPDLAAGIAQDKQNAITFLSMGVGLATLLKHKDMFDVDEVSLHTRAERRRSEKSGRELPDTRVSKISLGASGKGQLAAMTRVEPRDPDSEIKRRAHWVRGHWMRTAGGGLSFRVPHIRGAGPLIEQVRRVTE